MDEKDETMKHHSQDTEPSSCLSEKDTVLEKGNLDVAYQKLYPQIPQLQVETNIEDDCKVETREINHQVRDDSTPFLALTDRIVKKVKILGPTENLKDVFKKDFTENVAMFFTKAKTILPLNPEDIYTEAGERCRNEKSDVGDDMDEENLNVAESHKCQQDNLIRAEAECGNKEADFETDVVEKLYKNVTCLQNTYTDEFLAEGSFGSCLRRNYVNQVVVIKKMKSTSALNQLELEFSALHPHANIVRVLAYVILPFDRECYLFMEDGGEALFAKHKENQKFSEYELAKHDTSIMRQCLEAIGHIHKYGFLYLDGKPQNTVAQIDGNICDVKLCDMGSLLRAGQEHTGQHVVATLKYMAPETLSAYLGERLVHLTTKADVFNMGLLYYYILSGEHPWPKHRQKEALIRDLRFKANDQLLERMCPKAVGYKYELQRRMVARDPVDRPSVYECLEELRKMEVPFDPYKGPLPEPVEMIDDTEREMLPVVLDEFTLTAEFEEDCAAMVPQPPTSGIVSDFGSGAPTEESITVHPNLD
ncbi:unnamed protein product [Owenia fusiformis]|uniref:Uncharacterized protein n=1 Tax=Owenia fusiformis TaxID=6347 RepID=A0A8J1U6A6_OWEFU|nr:unnamed protein product [Owenia fusiformis]